VERILGFQSIAQVSGTYRCTHSETRKLARLILASRDGSLIQAMPRFGQFLPVAPGLQAPRYRSFVDVAPITYMIDASIAQIVA
jgi:hypothetical protein